MHKDVNAGKSFRACARGIVYTSSRIPKSLALHLLRHSLKHPARTPASARLGVRVVDTSTARAIVRLRPSPRLPGGLRLTVSGELVRLASTPPGVQYVCGMALRSIPLGASPVACPAGLIFPRKLRISERKRRELGLRPWDEGPFQPAPILVGSRRCRSCPSNLDPYLERAPGRVRCCYPALAFLFSEDMHGRGTPR